MLLKININLLNSIKLLKNSHLKRSLLYSSQYEKSLNLFIRNFSYAKNPLSTQNEPKLSPHLEPKEIQFKVPWGIIAGLEYGDPNGIPVLASHGWQDNCNSFEPLMPYILKKNNLHVIAIDQPGCGLSSHKPPGSYYSRYDYLVDIKRILDTLKWNKVTLLGHSQGAEYNFFYATCFPDQVERIISIETISPLVFPIETWNLTLPLAIQQRIKYDNILYGTNKKPSPVYSEDRALQLLMKAQNNSLNERSAKIMLKRGSRKVSEGIIFSRDIRIKAIPLEPINDIQQISEALKLLKSDLLIIRAENSLFKIPDDIRNTFYEIYKTRCPIFKDYLLPGSHHLHMNNPESLEDIINDFLKDSLSRSNS